MDSPSNFGIGSHGSQSNAVKFYYSKRKESASKELMRSGSSRQVLSPPAPPPLPCSDDEFVAGAFYEIDHEKLPPKSPIHLKAVRVVKVSETTKLDVTVCFPSTYSLRNYFSSIAAKSSSSRGDQTPELDEMFVMSTNHAGKILRRLVPSSQMNEEKHLQSFWLVVPPNAAAAAAAAAESHDESKMPAESVGGLQLALKYSGKLEWGLRRRVRYISRPLEVIPSPSAKREDDDDDSEPMEEVKNVICTRKRAREACKKNKKEDKKEKAAVAERKERKKIKSKKKKPRYEKGEKLKCEQSESVRVRGSKERWSTERYESAELKLLDIMREKGAVLGSPILRQQLRDEARKHIGDTGLLDHLLKHMAGKVVNERSERFRRRHNADGAMEYWLEPAELDDVRKKAGVIDPYWLPPAGWTQGDAASSACICSSECQKVTSELKEEIIILRREIEELQELKQLEKEDRDQQQQQSEAANIILQEKYETLVEKNKKLEEEMAGLIDTLKEVKEEMLLLKQERVKREEEDEERKKAMAAAEAENKSVVEDAKDGGSGNGEGGAGKINERRKGLLRRSGFRICKPPGTFLWPNMASNNNIAASNSSSPAALFSMISSTTTANSTVTSTSPATAVIGSGSGHGGAAVVPADHYAYQQYQQQQQQLAMMFGGAGSESGGGIPTPPSCSSTATSAPRLLLLPSPTTPRSSTSASPADPPQAVQQVVVPPLAVQHGNSGTPSSSSSPMYCSLMAAVARASVGDLVKKGEDSSSSVLNGQAEAAAAAAAAGANWSSSCNIATDLVLATPSPSSPYL